jgi:hypothetical protein
VVDGRRRHAPGRALRRVGRRTGRVVRLAGDPPAREADNEFVRATEQPRASSSPTRSRRSRSTRSPTCRGANDLLADGAPKERERHLKFIAPLFWNVSIA